MAGAKKKCIVHECEGGNGSLHRIPWRIHDRRDKWLQYLKMRETRGPVTTTSVVCHAHFAGGDASGDAVPCIIRQESISL